MPEKPFTSAILGIIGGSAAAAVIAFFTSSRIERQKFDYQIIQQALQADTQNERVTRLQFVVEAGFIQDASLQKHLVAKLQEKAKLPRLPAANASSQSRSPIAPRQVEPIVRNIIVQQLGLNPERVTAAAKLVEDLGADSLDLVELITAFEEEFAVVISDEDCQQLRSVNDFAAYIQAHSKRVIK